MEHLDFAIIIFIIILFIINLKLNSKIFYIFEKCIHIILIAWYASKNIFLGIFLGICYILYLKYFINAKLYQLLSNGVIVENLNDTIPDDKINFIISRYNENLNWTMEYPYNKYKYTVYNKGNNENFKKTNVTNIINLPNVGRESHTYLYHIINNYDNLKDINVFLPGSIDTNHTIFKKQLISSKLINYIEKYNTSVFISFDDIKNNSVVDEFRYFQVNSYSSMTKENYALNKEYKTEKCAYRPYYNWYNKVFGDRSSNAVIHYGIFSVDKKDILQYPKYYYENLISYVNKTSNPEAGHYFEKSWGVIFSPFNHTKVVNDNEIKDPFKNRYF
jgi:hypothetical protein